MLDLLVTSANSLSSAVKAGGGESAATVAVPVAGDPARTAGGGCCCGDKGVEPVAGDPARSAPQVKLELPDLLEDGVDVGAATVVVPVAGDPARTTRGGCCLCDGGDDDAGLELILTAGGNIDDDAGTRRRCFTSISTPVRLKKSAPSNGCCTAARTNRCRP